MSKYQQNLLGIHWFQLLSAGWQGLAMMHCNSTSCLVFAEHLSARLLILQSLFSVGRVWPQLLSYLRMQLKVWLMCKHLPRFGMQLRILFTKCCVDLHKFIIPSAVVVLTVSLLQHQNGKTLWWEHGREVKDWRKDRSNAREPKCSH